MPDVVTATTNSETVTINGVERVFKFLNSYDKAEIIREMRKRAKATLLENLKTAGVSAEQTAVDLADFEANLPGYSADASQRSWIDFVTEFEGMTFALGLSLEKTYPGEGAKLAKENDLNEADAFSVLLKICGLKRPERKPSPAPADSTPDTRSYGDGGDAPNPTPAAETIPPTAPA